jgi:ribose transport system permease protein
MSAGSKFTEAPASEPAAADRPELRPSTETAATKTLGGWRAWLTAPRRKASPWSLGALVLLLIAFAITSPGFYSQANWISIALYGMEFLLLAVGQTFVIITAGIDLSDGAVLGFSAMAGGLVMQTLYTGNPGMSGTLIVVIGFAVALGAGLAVGLLNGLLIAFLELSPFIVTLGTLGMVTAAIDLLNNGLSISDLPAQVGNIGLATPTGWLPVPFLVAVGCTLFCWVLLSKTRFGLRTYAIGSNPLAARRSGFAVRWHLIRVYLLSGALAGVGGMMVMARFAESSPAQGTNDELNAIAAVVIGGASLFGGTGTMFGTIIGTAIIATLVSGLVLANVAPFWQPFAVGAILIAAVALDRLRRRPE